MVGGPASGGPLAAPPPPYQPPAPYPPQQHQPPSPVVPPPMPYPPVSGVPMPGQHPPYGYQPSPYAPPPVWVPVYLPAPPPKAVRHSPLGWTIVVVCVLVIMVSGLVGVARFAWTPQPLSATWHTAGDAATPPAADAPASEWNAWARRAVASAVNEQSAALLAGDADGYLSAIDPDDAGLRDDLRRRFDVLHQMGVGQWSQDVRATPDVTGEFSWHADIQVSYCFGDPSCRLNTVEIGTDWRLAGDRLVLTGVSHSGAAQTGPRPWEAAELVVATGERTVVATSARLDRRLEDTLAAAEAAAAVADTLARWGGAPSRYVVFLASAGDWSTWYGFSQPEWAAGVYVNQTDNEVVINAPVVPTGDTKDLLTHELAHVATLSGNRDGIRGPVWWLVEGIADYAMMMGRPLYDYVSISDVRTFVAQSWDGDPAVDQPAVDATNEDAGARYGVAFLSVWRMADQYGQDAMLDFFGRVVHDGESLETAAQAAYGQSWETVRADGEDFIRSV